LQVFHHHGDGVSGYKALVDAPADLEKRLRDGDADALSTLWALHRERLGRLVRFRMDARLPRRIDSDDVLQEAFIAARARIAHFAGDGFQSAFVWLRTVTLQSLVDAHRHHLGAQKRDAGREVADAASPAHATSSAALVQRLSAGAASPSAAVIGAERAELVQRAVATLSEADQEIIALRHGEQLGNIETAEVLGIEAKAASIRYVRALHRLKEALSSRGGLTTEVGRAR
jgi:RNA polymerase sigma-70 factor (ECF subfamily)